MYFCFASLFKCLGNGASFQEHKSALLLPASTIGMPAAAAINIPSSSMRCNYIYVYKPSVLFESAEFRAGMFLVLLFEGIKLGKLVPGGLNYAKSSPAAAALLSLYLCDESIIWPSRFLP